MENIHIIKEKLDHVMSIGSFLLENNAFKIYSDLHVKLQEYEKIEDFLVANKTINDWKEHYLSYLKTCDGYDPESKIPSYHNLGKYLEKILDGRFVKEEKKDSNVTLEKHIIIWFEKNEKLLFDTDKEIVQAAFVTLFMI